MQTKLKEELQAKRDVSNCIWGESLSSCFLHVWKFLLVWTGGRQAGSAPAGAPPRCAYSTDAGKGRGPGRRGDHMGAHAAPLEGGPCAKARVPERKVLRAGGAPSLALWLPCPIAPPCPPPILSAGPSGPY